jgi:hypothetical protein
VANITNAIQSLCPDAEFVIIADDYSTIIWHKIEGNAPTLAQVKAEMKRLSDLEVSAQATKDAAKASAIAKLEALGLTEDEAKAIIG